LALDRTLIPKAGAATGLEKSEKRGVQAAINVRKTLGAVDFTTKTEPTPMIFWFWTRPAINATPWCRRWRLSWASRWHAEELALTAPAAATPRSLLCCAKVSLFLPQPRRERKIAPLARILGIDSSTLYRKRKHLGL